MVNPRYLHDEAGRAEIKRVMLKALGSEEDFIEQLEVFELLSALNKFEVTRDLNRVLWFRAARFLRTRLGRLATQTLLSSASSNSEGTWRLRVSERRVRDYSDPGNERQKRMASRDAIIGAAVLARMKSGLSIKKACQKVSAEFEWQKRGITKLQPSGVETSFKRFRARAVEMAAIVGSQADPDLWRPAGSPSSSRFAER